MKLSFVVKIKKKRKNFLHHIHTDKTVHDRHCLILDSVLLIVLRTLLSQMLAWAPTLICQGKLSVMQVSWMESLCILAP